MSSLRRREPDRQRRAPSLTRRQLLLGGATAALLAGCGGARPGAAPVATLRVLLSLNAYEREFFGRAVLPPFEERHRVRVELASGTSSEAIDRLSGGQRDLDLLAVDREALGMLIAGGLARDVDAARGAVPEEVVPSVLPGLERGGRLYALPLRPAVWTTFYNGATLEAAGLTPPATWDELLAVARRLHGIAEGGRVALQGAEGPPAAQSLIELVWAFGGDPLALDDAGSLAAATFLQRLAPALAPLSRDTKLDSMTTALGSDRVALGPNWSFVAADLVQRGGKREIGVYAGPAGPGGLARLVSGQVLIVPAGAPNPDGALALAAHLWSKPIQELLAGQLAWLPLRRDAFDAAPEWQRAVAGAAREALLAARTLPPLRDRETLDTILGDAFRQIAFAGTPPREALDRAAGLLRGLR